MTNVTPAAAWMDQLSDRLGSLIPGGYRLPPRHPVKVSLVMALLGFASGWLTTILGFAATWILIEFFTSLALKLLDAIPSAAGYDPLFLSFQILEGLLFGTLVFVPLAAWAGSKWPLQGLLIVLCWTAFNGAWWFSRLSPVDSEYATEQFVAGFALGTCSVLLCMAPFRRIALSWIIVTIPISASSHGLIWLGIVFVDAHLVPIGWMDWRDPLLFGWFFSLTQAVLAVCLGVPLWDASPRATFEP